MDCRKQVCRPSHLVGLGFIALVSVAPLAAITIPAGTPIEVRTINEINSKRAVVGEQFRASVADPVVVGNRVVIPRGAEATVQLLRTASGNYGVKLHKITVDGRRYDVASSSAELKPASKRGKAVTRGLGGAGVGAAIGGIAGGGKGLGIGALTGGTLGAASTMVGGKKVEVPPETLLSFELRAPVPIHSAGPGRRPAE